MAALETRGLGKKDRVCLHDVCHYLLVQEKRNQGWKSWFLTRDRTLGKAATVLDSGQIPFCFPLAGFLQSVSPFLEAPETQRSLVDLFSAVLNGEIGDLSGESLFDLSELKIITEFHSDVLSTPVEQLLPAFDYVKNTVLEGKPLRQDDHTKVALELKKFLTSSAEEKQEVLQAEAMRQKRVADDERAKRELAERDAEDKQSEVSRLEAEVKEAGCREQTYAKRDRRRLAGIAMLGAMLTSGIWAFDSEIVASLLPSLSLEGGLDSVLHIAVRPCGVSGSFCHLFSSHPSIETDLPHGCLHSHCGYRARWFQSS